MQRNGGNNHVAASLAHVHTQEVTSSLTDVNKNEAQTADVANPVMVPDVIETAADGEKIKVVLTLENGTTTTATTTTTTTSSSQVTPSAQTDAKTKTKKKEKKTADSEHRTFRLIDIIRSPKTPPTRRKSQRQRRQDRETKATIRMAIIIAFFCGFWIGFFTIYLLQGLFGGRLRIPQELDAFFFWLGYSNSAINPILYTIFNDDFRKAFQKMLGCYRKAPRGGAYARTRN